MRALILIICAWAGIWILWEVKGENFADDTISLLWIKKKQQKFVKS